MRRSGLGLSLGVAALLGSACGSTATSTGAGSGGPTQTLSPTSTGLAKPADPGQAVTAAAARTATFHDVRYDLSGNVTHGGNSSDYTGSVAVTTAPPRIDSKNTPILGGRAIETIQDFASHAFCTFPQGAPKQRFVDQTMTAAEIDPFSTIVKNGSGWAYLADVSAPDGHTSWQVMGQYNQSSPAATAAGLTYTLSTMTVFIDSRSGKIEKTVEHAKLTDKAGAPTERTTIQQNFVYDTGAVIAAC